MGSTLTAQGNTEAYSSGNLICTTWIRYYGSPSQQDLATETQKNSLTCGIISVALISLNILGPITVRGVEEVNVFIIITGQELYQEQEHSSEGKGWKIQESRSWGLGWGFLPVVPPPNTQV